MEKETAVLERVVEGLAAEGIAASLENSDHINIDLNGNILALGFANGDLGWNYHTPDGQRIDAGASADLTIDSPIHELVEYAKKTLAQVRPVLRTPDTIG